MKRPGSGHFHIGMPGARHALAESASVSCVAGARLEPAYAVRYLVTDWIQSVNAETRV